MIYVVSFGGYDFADQLDLSDSYSIARRGATQALGGAGGSLDLVGTGPDPAAETVITKTLTLEAATPAALHTALNTLRGQMMLSQNDWRQGTRVLVAALPDGTYWGTWAKCVSVTWTTDFYHINNGWQGDISITWRRTWSQWWIYGEYNPLGDHLGTLADTDTAGYTFGDGAAIQAVSGTPTDFTITNNGNARIFNGIIELDGAVQNPTIQNLTNEHSLAWSGTLAAGDRLTINVATYAAKKNGALGEWANITLGTERGQIQAMVLEPGENNMRITSTSPDFTFRYYFADQWV